MACSELSQQVASSDCRSTVQVNSVVKCARWPAITRQARELITPWLLLRFVCVPEFERVSYAFYKSLAHMPAYAGLKFRITGVERIVNPTLMDTFFASLRYFHEQGYNSEHAIRSVYHGTKSSNITAIVQHNLSLDKKGQTDSGWFGAGLYFSRHADYVIQYYTTGYFKRVRAGDKGKLLQFDILPGRMHRVKKMQSGADRTPQFDSHCSPNEFEYVLFDPRHVLPRYVISLEVEKAAGASFDGSAEQKGPSH